MYISTHQALLDFCQRVREFDAIAVDTEFLRERTFHPRLCLVQIATPAESVAVDPLVIDDLSPLAELMADESVTKVFHACSQDMEVMLHTVGVLPRPIFDTQVAAAFLGERQQISYGALVQTFCGVSLPKTESLTDWSRRPLTDKQIEYAIDDVKYLIVAYTEMMSRLRELGRVDWVLDELRPLPRLQRMNEILRREIEVTAMEQDIESKVRSRVGKIQKDFVLREQIKVLQNEIGEGGEDEELDEYREKISKAHLSEEVERKLLKDVDKLAKQPFGSAEASVLRNYLDTCMEMPWGEETKERASVDAARKILDRDHYGLQKVKERILEFIAVRQLNPEAKGQILCLVGPPGVGKTSIALSVAKAMNRKVARLSLGGVRDEADIRGHRKTYIGAMPGRIIEAISRSGSMNPLLVLDEVDKMGSDGRGDPASALLEVLDSEQNYAFRDHYLEIPVDLSRVMFIMTANTLDTIPRPLLDRMEIIEIPSYTDEEKVQIAQRHLLPKERQAHGLTASSLRVDESAIRAAIALYTRESGVRSLERQLGKICRKAAMQLATSDVKRVTVTEKNIKDFLGAPRAAQEKIPEKDLVGVVNGLAWTEVGGEILPVEVGVMDGSGKVELTGNLGDVMQESCRAALSCLRQRAQELGIAPDFYKTKDIHIHFPEGAIPKDGPSAGIAIATAVLSALTGQAVHRDVAMTGEITLRGRVLAIGGLREKTMGALRAGVHTVILPKENEKDLDEIDPLVREKLRFVPVETVDAVFAEALVLPEKCTAAAHESYLPPVQESAHSALRAGEMS